MWIKMSKAYLQSKDETLTTGTYQLIINPIILIGKTKDAVINIINEFCPISKDYGGKTWIVEGAWLEGHNIGVQIRIMENPIPIIAIIAGCGFLLGGFLLWQVLVEVRKLFEFSGISGLGKLAFFSAILGGVWYFGFKRKRKK